MARRGGPSPDRRLGPRGYGTDNATALASILCETSTILARFTGRGRTGGRAASAPGAEGTRFGRTQSIGPPPPRRPFGGSGQAPGDTGPCAERVHVRGAKKQKTTLAEAAGEAAPLSAETTAETAEPVPRNKSPMLRRTRRSSRRHKRWPQERGRGLCKGREANSGTLRRLVMRRNARGMDCAQPDRVVCMRVCPTMRLSGLCVESRSGAGVRSRLLHRCGMTQADAVVAIMGALAVRFVGAALGAPGRLLVVDDEAARCLPKRPRTGVPHFR